jgi:hypothetical protein
LITVKNTKQNDFSTEIKSKKVNSILRKLIEAFESFEDEELLTICAKKCAEHSVYEILNLLSLKDDIALHNYWKEVEREIQNFKIRQMILTDHTITAEINNGNIVVEPFIPENLGTNSIDLTLSNTLILYTDSVLDVRKKNLSAPSDYSC